MNDKLRISAHAFLRLTQRRISVTDVLSTVEHGRRVHRGHADFHVMLDRCIPRGREREFERLRGLVVVVEAHNGLKAITTAYRNRRAIRRIKRKGKRYHGSWLNSAVINLAVNNGVGVAA